VRVDRDLHGTLIYGMTESQSSPTPDPGPPLVAAPADIELDALARDAEAAETTPVRSRIPSAPPSFFGLLPNEVEGALTAAGWPKYRAHQVLDWVYAKRTRDPAAMSNLGKAQREQLGGLVDLTLPRIHRQIQSPKADSVKYALELHDKTRVESVAMLSKRGVTLCVSTQAGCGMACVFCATGTLGLARNLKADEIVAQVVHMLETTGWEDPGFNIVFMGMGEPLANYAQTLKAINVLRAEDGLRVGSRRITLSTCGMVPQMHRLAKEGLQVGLAISLHATTDELRDRLVPINRRYPLRELVRAADFYATHTGRRVTLEYILLAGVNDRKGDAERLADIANSLPCKINLIPYNPVPQLPWQRPTDEAIQRFADWLFPRCPAVTLRWSQGGEIAAACGQLGAKA
jgi:23S rRNA (adenine2503-C2)-methyltransferase